MNTSNNLKWVLAIAIPSLFSMHLLAQQKSGPAESISQPLIATKYTADPAPMVYNDTVFLYTTHDEDIANGFDMKDWLLYTSTDMVNWTDHGAVASLKSFNWYKKDNGAWAEQVIERDGKFYMYCPIHGSGISVLVADSPYGPFHDPLGKPLVWQKEHWYDIDPSVWIDDDGQAYMYWGNPNLYYVKLNKDMISYSGDIIQVEKPKDYQEGPWFYKRQGHYYLAFASTCCPEGIGYAMSDSPTGPWEHKGDIMPHTNKSRGNHPGIIEYKGKSYVFGLNYELMHYETTEHHERRSVSANEMHYRADGTIEPVEWWSENPVAQISLFNPYRRVEAETMAWAQWVKTAQDPNRGIYVTDIQNGDYIQLRGLDFKKGAKSFEICAMPLCGGQIELHLDKVDGPLIGTCAISSGTVSGFTWQSYKTRVEKVGGQHDLFLVFKGENGNLFDLDYWKFK